MISNFTLSIRSKRIIKIIILSLIILISMIGLLRPALADTIPSQFKVIKVVSVNQLELSNHQVISLYGVSSVPYEGYTGSNLKLNFFNPNNLSTSEIDTTYENASYYISELVKNKLVFTKEMTNRQYLVNIGDQLINKLIIQHGYAVLNQANDNPNVDTQLINAQEDAHQANLGLWAITKTEYHNKSSVTMDRGMFWWLIFGIIITLLFSIYQSIRRKYLILFLILASVDTISMIYLVGWQVLTKWQMVALFACIFIEILGLLSLAFRYQGFLYIFVIQVTSIILVIVAFASIYSFVSNNDVHPTVIRSAANPYYFTQSHYPESNYLSLPAMQNANGLWYHLSFLNAFYFSATTFFTVGYGDITPQGDLRIWAVFEMITGSMFQAFIITALVTKARFNNLIKRFNLRLDKITRKKSI